VFIAPVVITLHDLQLHAVRPAGFAYRLRH
jgi:hypothetical protein